MSKAGDGPKPRKLWSEQEDDILRREVAKQASRGKVQDWRIIAAKLPDRNNKDCRKRWIKLDSPVNKGSWSEEEDQRLREAVWQHSTVSVTSIYSPEIARCLPLLKLTAVFSTTDGQRLLEPWVRDMLIVSERNKPPTATIFCSFLNPECTKRWLHFLSPDLDHSEWNEDDDARLLAAVESSGHNWRKIVDEVLEGRSATDAKNRYFHTPAAYLESVLIPGFTSNRYSILQQRSKRHSNPSLQGPRPSRRKQSCSMNPKGSSRATNKEASNGSISAKPMNNPISGTVDTPQKGTSREGTMCLPDHLDPMFMQMANTGFEYPTHPMSTQQTQQQQQQNYAMMLPPNWQEAQMPPIMESLQCFQQPMNNMSQFNPNLFTNDVVCGSDIPNPLVDSYMDISCTGIEASSLLPSPPASTECFGGPSETHAAIKPPGRGDERITEEGDDDDEDDDDGEEDGNEREVGRATEVADGQSYQGNQQGSPEAWMKEHSSSSSSGNSNRKSTVVLKNMKQDLVGQVLGLLFSSESAVDVKIFSQD